MIYIYRRAASSSARALCSALNARRLRSVEQFRRRGPGRNVLVCWGEAAPPQWEGPNVLNGAPILQKFTDAQRLQAAGVPTIRVNLTAVPAAQAVEGPRPLYPLQAAHLSEADARFLLISLQNYLDAPLPRIPAPQEQWLGRRNNHIGGLDLLTPPAAPDYYVKREELRREFRVHSFLGASIRSGVKIHRESAPIHHEWIRSWDGGWRVSYDGTSCRQRHRDLAHRAVAALGLQFGAVDIGEKADGSLLVLEVNRAPGLEGGTIAAYAQAIQQWVNRD